MLFTHLFLLLLALGTPCAYAQQTHTSVPAKKVRKNRFTFHYNDAPLVDIINELASKLNYNIILPQGAKTIKEKVTLHFDKEFKLREAWHMLTTILDKADYTIVPKKNTYTIVKNSTNVGREPLPLYINTSHTQLPSSDQRIRYLYYLMHVKATGQSDDEFFAVLKQVLPANATFKIDPAANALVMVARSNDIKAAMDIIVQLDRPGFQEKMDIILLKHAQAKVVSDLFKQQILQTAQKPPNRYRLDAKKQSDDTYFSKHTRIIADERSNSLIVLGRADAVERLKNFIFKHIDVELDSGMSVLHVYELQYLNAEEFAPVLQQIVQSSNVGGTGQSKGGVQKGGTERFFDNVIVKTDTIPAAQGQESRYYGGNKLIIACRNDDWKRIKKLIEELDTPQRQVFIEVLVADLTIEDTRLLGSLLRNPAKIPLPGQLEFQSAHLNPGVLPDSFDNPETISVIDNGTDHPDVVSDILRESVDNSGNKSDAGPNSIAKLLDAGSTAISLSDNDGKTWSLLQLLKTFEHTKILSHPHVIALHNQMATIEIGNTRLVEGEATGNINPIRKQETIEASLKVNITPKISTSDTVNVQIQIDIDEFLEAGNARATREVITNANIENKGILALGGLIQSNAQKSSEKTPLLADVPILGYFFKRRKGSLRKTNLTVFISPTIIEPRLRAGASEYTKDYIKLAKDYTNDGELFDSLRDPVTRWFFKTGSDARDIVDDFVKKDITGLNSIGENSVPVPVKRSDYEGKKETIKEVAKSDELRLVQNKTKPIQKDPTNTSDPIIAFDKERYAQELKEKVQRDADPFALS